MAASLQCDAPVREAQHRMYVVRNGFVYACPGLASEATRFSVSVLLSRTGAPFTLEVKGRQDHASAFVIQPGIWRRTHAAGVPILSIGVGAASPWFRTISTLKMPQGLLALSRADLAHCDDAIDAAFAGDLSAHGAKTLCDAVMKTITARLQPPRPLDARIQRVLAMIHADCHASLDDMADTVHLSYHRLSHLFSESMGLALRSYVLSRKLDVAFAMASQGMTVTQMAAAAGFSDAAHFSRIWMRSAGAPPSYFLHNLDISIRSWFNGE